MRRAISAVVVSIAFGNVAPSAQDHHLRPLIEQDLATVTITVHAAPTVPPVVVGRALEEASAIWRQTGVAFKWLKEDSSPDRLHAAAGDAPARHHRREPRHTARQRSPARMGQFCRRRTGRRHSYLPPQCGAVHPGIWRGRRSDASHESCRALSSARPQLGRALAHEIGHYLLRSRGHATNGLMKGRRTVKEFIDPNHHGFDIDASDREAAARRIREIAREPGRATIVG